MAHLGPVAAVAAAMALPETLSTADRVTVASSYFGGKYDYY